MPVFESASASASPDSFPSPRPWPACFAVTAFLGTFTTLVGDAVASGGSTTFVGDSGEVPTVGGPFHDPRMRQPRPRPKQQKVDATFASIVGELTASGGIGSMSGTTAYPLTTEGYNELVLELI